MPERPSVRAELRLSDMHEDYPEMIRHVSEITFME